VGASPSRGRVRERVTGGKTSSRERVTESVRDVGGWVEKPQVFDPNK